MSKNWYCIQVTANRVKSFKERLEESIENAGLGMKEKFGDVFSPEEEVVEMKKGKRKVSKRKFFPSYVFIEMDMTPETWHLVNKLPMIKGFVGDINTTARIEGEWRAPQPVNPEEIIRIRSQEQAGADKPRPKVMFEIGEAVRIKDGPFTNFTGNVNDVNYDTNRISVSVNVFNRPTEIQIDFDQVEKM